MRKFPSILKTASSVLAIAGGLALFPAGSMAAEGDGASATEQGKAIAFDRKKRSWHDLIAGTVVVYDKD